MVWFTRNLSFVFLSVSSITQKVADEFWWFFYGVVACVTSKSWLTFDGEKVKTLPQSPITNATAHSSWMGHSGVASCSTCRTALKAALPAFVQVCSLSARIAIADGTLILDQLFVDFCCGFVEFWSAISYKSFNKRGNTTTVIYASSVALCGLWVVRIDPLCFCADVVKGD